VPSALLWYSFIALRGAVRRCSGTHSAFFVPFGAALVLVQFFAPSALLWYSFSVLRAFGAALVLVQFFVPSALL
jgi:hypothetical protein